MSLSPRARLLNLHSRSAAVSTRRRAQLPPFAASHCQCAVTLPNTQTAAAAAVERYSAMDLDPQAGRTRYTPALSLDVSLLNRFACVKPPCLPVEVCSGALGELDDLFKARATWTRRVRSSVWTLNCYSIDGDVV